MGSALWLQVGSMAVSGILALLFMVGAFFETRRFLRKLNNHPQQTTAARRERESWR
ncbi:MAG: hypothetical protein K6T31_00690 [Alicyclobacillus sp.]|nr:hypothetical protein [Alicyclobacillus sp.]